MTFGWLDEGLKKERKKKAIHILHYLENGLSSPPSAGQAEGAETAATLRAERERRSHEQKKIRKIKGLALTQPPTKMGSGNSRRRQGEKKSCIHCEII
jgi:hypothetical protein